MRKEGGCFLTKRERGFIIHGAWALENLRYFMFFLCCVLGSSESRTRSAKVKNDHRSKFSNLSNWKEEAWKNQGFNGIRTRDLRDTGATLYQMTYEATHWERGQFMEFISPMHEEWNDVKYIWNNSYLNLEPQFKYELFSYILLKIINNSSS